MDSIIAKVISALLGGSLAVYLSTGWAAKFFETTSQDKSSQTPSLQLRSNSKTLSQYRPCPAYPSNSLVGSWRSSHTDKNGRVSNTSLRLNSDGSFTSKLSQNTPNLPFKREPKNSNNQGLWSASSCVFSLLITPKEIDLRPYSKHYLLEQVSPNEFQAVKLGNLSNIIFRRADLEPSSEGQHEI